MSFRVVRHDGRKYRPFDLVQVERRKPYVPYVQDF